MRALGGALIALVLTACSPQANAPVVEQEPIVNGDWRPFQASLTPLPAQLPKGGAVSLAGAWTLASSDTDRLRGLSDIKPDGYGRLFLVSDDGDLVDLPERVGPRVAGRLRRLSGRKGRPLLEKETGDAEGLIVLPNGQMLVSFERRHRITLYSEEGVYAGSVNAPTARMKPNDGVEAIAEAEGGGWWAAAQDGRLWRCDYDARCERQRARLARAGVAVTGMSLDPRKPGRLFVLRREMRPGGFVSVVSTVEADRLGERHPPMTEVLRLDAAAGLPDNFEGVGARRLEDGRVRLWLVADDGFNSRSVIVAADLR